ncbi:MAG: hypothetical protein ACRELC_02075 [Gemmatimonadota bacterium]
MAESIAPHQTGHEAAGEASRLECPHPLQVAAYRRLTPAERLAAAFEMTRFVRAHLRSQLRARHPEWSDSRLSEEVAARFLGDA